MSARFVLLGSLRRASEWFNLVAQWSNGCFPSNSSNAYPPMNFALAGVIPDVYRRS